MSSKMVVYYVNTETREILNKWSANLLDTIDQAIESMREYCIAADQSLEHPYALVCTDRDPFPPQKPGKKPSWTQYRMTAQIKADCAEKLARLREQDDFGLE